MYKFNNNVNVDLTVPHGHKGEGSEISAKEFLRVKNIFLNDGLDYSTGKRVTLQDIMNTTNAAPLLPKVMVSMIKESQEPLLIGASLLDQIQHKPYTTISMPAMGALTADDIPEGGAYPESGINLGGSTTTATIGKVGMAFGFTEEMLRYSDFNLMGLFMREAGRAMARHKETKIFRHILSMGITAFDNSDPTTSLFGVTHGRDLDGSANGSMIMDDLFDMLAAGMHNGFQMDTLLVHPLTWLMWVKDPVMRAFALQSGSGPFFQKWSGSVAQREPFDNGGRTGISTGRDIVPGSAATGEDASPVDDYSQQMTSAPMIPSYFGFPFRIVVSPFVPFDPNTMLTDIILFQSGTLGALVVDEGLTTEEWNDPRVDIRKVKLRERYGIMIYDEGQGALIARNVKVVPNQVVLPAQATYALSNGIAAIPATTAVV